MKQARFTTVAARNLLVNARTVEQAKKNKLPQKPTNFGERERGFYGVIYEIDFATGNYGWNTAEAQDDGEYVENEDWDFGSKWDDNFAYEVSGFKFVPIGSVVWLYPALGQKHYSFEWQERWAWGKADSTISKGGSGAISIYDFDFADTGENQTCLCKFNAATSGKWGQAIWNNGTWVFQQVEC